VPTRTQAAFAAKPTGLSLGFFHFRLIINLAFLRIRNNFACVSVHTNVA
jgi:hypothetical protein